jgi:hypothetical protein
VLLVGLHIIGFFWGDVSLSNTLLRRDTGSFAAYLADAETGELPDLQAGGRLTEETIAVAISNRIVAQYRTLWKELHGPEELDQSKCRLINQRVERLDDLGFDIEELAIKSDKTGTQVRIQPKVVDDGQHSRRPPRLTGLDAEENQARRLLNDLDSYRVKYNKQDLDEEVVAHEWVMRVFEPVIRAIPKGLRG